jgi:hypothetical protein
MPGTEAGGSRQEIVAFVRVSILIMAEWRYPAKQRTIGSVHWEAEMVQFHWAIGGAVIFVALLLLAKRPPRADRDFMANRPTLDPRPMIR